MEQRDIEARVSELEKRSRTVLIALCASAAIAVIALIVAVRALMPFLALRYAMREFAASSTNEESRKPVVTHVSPSQPENVQPSQESQDEAQKLLSVLDVRVTAKRLLPENYEAGRYRPDVELTLQADNQSDRKVRAYQGTFDVRDLLGNQIIVLTIKDQTLIGPHQKRQFQQYFEINKFEDRDTRFEAESYENLRFNWKAGKIIFADGTSVGADQ